MDEKKMREITKGTMNSDELALDDVMMHKVAVAETFKQPDLGKLVAMVHADTDNRLIGFLNLIKQVSGVKKLNWDNPNGLYAAKIYDPELTTDNPEVAEKFRDKMNYHNGYMQVKVVSLHV